MFICPSCGKTLVRQKTLHGICWTCPSCSGRLVGMGPLRKTVTRDVMNAVWARVREKEGVTGRACPGCHLHFLEVYPEHRAHLPPLDVCHRCHLVWFDPGEFDVLPQLQLEKKEEDVSPLVKQAGALLSIQLDREREKRKFLTGESPDEWWKYLPAFFGMPVEQDASGVRYLPVFTWGLSLVILLATLAAFATGIHDAVYRFGFIPADPGRYFGLTFFTSFFLHAGLVHILGNLYFFLVFGDNVEDYLGSWSFLCLVAAATLAGDTLHMMVDRQPAVPVIGASGGISGVLAFYALRFPRVRLAFMVRYFILFRWFAIPAWLGFVLWLLLQSVGVWQQLAGFSHVSALAHLGGAAVGFVFWLGMRER